VERKLRPARPKKGKKPRNRPDGQVSAWKHLSVLAARGVRIEDPRTTFVAPEATVEPGATLRPFVVVEGRSVVRAGAMVGPFVRLVNAEIGENAQVFDHCLILESAVAARAQVGPFTHIRPGSHVGDGARVGNFVELKKARLGEGAKAPHLTYLGDVQVGPRANIGAGTITCNYDGSAKYQTSIGADAFVGSDSTLVAPVTVGDGAYIAAGSTITHDVPADALALGRARQVVKPGWARERRARKGGAH
jgi:bifunctional UDP-N-acetylglucosamine pyrophosphorylase/glucosamine-1-phosphate N-acetyltransferase